MKTYTEFESSQICIIYMYIHLRQGVLQSVLHMTRSVLRPSKINHDGVLIMNISHGSIAHPQYASFNPVGASCHGSEMI